MQTRTTRLIATTLTGLGVLAAVLVEPAVAASERGTTTYRVLGGRIVITFDESALHDTGMSVITRTDTDVADVPHGASFALQSDSTLRLDPAETLPESGAASVLRSRGALLFGAEGRTYAAGDLVIHRPLDGPWLVASTLHGSGDDAVILEMPELLADIRPVDQRFRLAADVAVAPSLAEALAAPHAVGQVIGTMTVEARIERVGLPGAAEPNPPPVPAADRQLANIAASGPDVIVGELYSPLSFGSVGGISAFSIGTISCNAGNEELLWISSTHEHPVIAQNMYRLLDGRFEQIGQSWLKHGFAALTGNTCELGCHPPGTSSRLGIGCSDPYSAGLNASQFNLGPKSEVNASTGIFTFPRVLNPPIDATIGRRLQVHDVDLEPALNPGALYFIEGHYITPDDAAAGNDDNNAAYRRLLVNGANGSFVIGIQEETQREKAAIEAWFDNDNAVYRAHVDVPEDGRFYVFAKSTDLGGGTWSYEYAVQNLNSHRSAGSFSVPIDPQTNVGAIGFHDVDYHSGEIYDGTNWVPSVSDSAITWSVVAAGAATNALRWGTLYNFRFHADRPPTSTGVTLGLWRTGEPAEAIATSIGPLREAQDCQGQCVPASVPLAEPQPLIKNRFLSFVPGNTVCPTAYRVTFTSLPPPFDQLNGEQMWVREPTVYCENSSQRFPPPGGCGPSPGRPARTFTAATLGCTPHYTDWTTFETIHLFHEAIIPEGSYAVQAISDGCDANAVDSYSRPLDLPTGRWGDVGSGCTPLPCGPPDGAVHVIPDIWVMLQKFANVPDAPMKAIIDLQPGRLDFTIDILDVLYALKGFGGGDYPFVNVPDACSN